MARLPTGTNGPVVFRRGRNFVAKLAAAKALNIDVLTDQGRSHGVAVEPGLGPEAAETMIRKAFQIAR